MRRLLLLLLFLAAPAGAAITFNGGSPMTLAASYTGSARPYGGGVILHVGGTFDGANVALQVSGGAGWITADTCDLMTAAQVCRAAVGPVDLRLTITGAGAGTSITAVGFEVQAVVASTGGTGSVTFDLVGPGANTGALTIDTGGTLAATGTGAITATAVPWSGITSSPFSYAAPDTIQTQPAAGGSLRIRPNGGAGATDIFLKPSTKSIFYATDRVDFDSAAAFGGLALYDDAQPVLLVDDTFGVFGEAGGSGWNLTPNAPSLTACTVHPKNGGPCIAASATVGGLNVGTANLLTWETGKVTVNGCIDYGPLSVAPTGVTCARYFDIELAEWCYYTGAAWVEMDDSVTGCS